MNTAEQLARLQHWLDTHPVTSPDINAGPRVLEDVDTLVRSRHGVVTADSYRRTADRPKEPWQDDLAVAAGDVRAWEVEGWSAA